MWGRHLLDETFQTRSQKSPRSYSVPCMYIYIYIHVQSLVCVMCSLCSVLCAGCSLCYVQYFVCVMCSLRSVLCAVYSHEPHRFAQSMIRFARVTRFARFWVQHQYMTDFWDLPTNCLMTSPECVDGYMRNHVIPLSLSLSLYIYIYI